MNDYYKNNGSSYLKYWDVNNLQGWAASQKLPVNGFKQVEDLSEIDKSFMKIYNEKVKEEHFLEVAIEYLVELRELHNDLPFLPERMKTVKFRNLLLFHMIKMNVLFT